MKVGESISFLAPSLLALVRWQTVTNEALFWIIVYAIAGLLFFGSAAVIALIGFKDLKDLLSRTEKKE